MQEIVSNIGKSMKRITRTIKEIFKSETAIQFLAIGIISVALGILALNLLIYIMQN